MKLPALIVFSLASMFARTSLAGSSDEAVVDPSVPASTPSCAIHSPSASWKIPVNASGIPVIVDEIAGAKLTPVVTLSPTAEYMLLTDTSGGGIVGRNRILAITGAKVGDAFDVVLGGTCANADAKTVTNFPLHVEFVAEATLPTVLGTLKEDPVGRTTLTFDPSFLPYESLATVTFLREGASLGVYGAGTHSANDIYGVQGCFGGGCNNGLSTLHLLAAGVCTNGRASGVVEVKLTATATIAGAQTQPAPVDGTLHFDCSKATDDELAHDVAPSTGCSVADIGSRNGNVTAIGLLASLGLCAGALRRRRRA